MGPVPSATIVWFRHDLRLDDQRALRAAVERGRPVIPLFIWAPEEEGRWPPGGASRWWLHQSLTALDSALRKFGSRLIIRRGPSLDTLVQVARQARVDAVFWNRRYEPTIIARDAVNERRLRSDGLSVETFNSALLFEPHTVQTGAGKPFQVFTPFWKCCLSHDEPAAPRPAPRRLPTPDKWPDSISIADLRLEPTIDWAAGLRATWLPGEAGAKRRLKNFLAGVVEHYETGRDLPAADGTSALSPHLHFGEVSPRRIWHAVKEACTAPGRRLTANAAAFLREIGWREFAYHLLYHFPHTPEEPLRAQFADFPWDENSSGLRAWQRGRTGFPWIDAGMRQLWHTGWMHNRVRMAVASFLVKDLLLPWQAGAAWFWDTLVDADLANNTLGWQWTAGCGADAAPFFRIFNPVTQGEKFDPAGDYIRQWVPELAKLPEQWIHHPWKAPADDLSAAGIDLGRTYPGPIVDHAAARVRALAALAETKGKVTTETRRARSCK